MSSIFLNHQTQVVVDRKVYAKLVAEHAALRSRRHARARRDRLAVRATMPARPVATDAPDSLDSSNAPVPIRTIPRQRTKHE